MAIILSGSDGSSEISGSGTTYTDSGSTSAFAGRRRTATVGSDGGPSIYDHGNVGQDRTVASRQIRRPSTFRLRARRLLTVLRAQPSCMV